MAIKPILHRILVLPDKLEDKDKAFAAASRIEGFKIYGAEKDREQAAIDTGEVIDMGATAFLDFKTESPIQKGDSVVYARYGGKKVTDPVTNVDYVLLNDEDVIAILTKEGA